MSTTVTILPTSYTYSNVTYVVVSNGTNAYTNTSSTSYASVRGRSGSSYGPYYFSLNFPRFDSVVPTGSVVTSISVKLKAYRNSVQSSSSTYRPFLGRAYTTGSSGTHISGSDLTSSLTTSAAVYTFPTLSWSKVSSISALSINIPLKATSNSNPYVYIYGAELEITYDDPKTLTVSTNEVDISYYTYPSDGIMNKSYAQVYIEGNLNDIQVTDNGVDITSSLTYYNDDGSYIHDKYYYELNGDQINVDHNIVISHSSPQTTYVVTASTTESNWTVATSADEYNGIVGAGRGCMVYVDAEDTYVQCVDNNIDVTSSLIYIPETDYGGGFIRPAFFYYTISNISENHTVVFSRSNTPTVCIISATSTCDAIYDVYAGDNSSGSTYTSVGGSCQIMFSGYENTPSTGFIVTDNDIDVSNLLVYINDTDHNTSYYTYTITNIQSDHNVVISYTGETYKITTLSSNTSQFRVGASCDTYSSPGISKSEISVFAGDAVTSYVYWGTSSHWSGYPSNMHILDNDVDVTNLFSSATNNDGGQLYYYYNFTNVSSDHTILVYDGDVYIRVIYTDPTLYSDIYQGTSHNITDFRGVTIGSNCGIDIYIQSADFLQDVIVTDNGVNINNSLVYYTTGGDEGGTRYYYEYTLNNIQTSHTIVISSSQNIVYLKSNGSWLQTTKVYKKSNNAWVEQSDYSSLFSNNDIWIKV